MVEHGFPQSQPEPGDRPEDRRAPQPGGPAPSAPGGATPTGAPEEQPSPARGRISRSLQLRLLSAGLIIPTVLILIVLGGAPFLLVVVAIIVLALREFYDIIEVKGLNPQKTAGIVGAALLGIVSYVGNEYQTNVLLTAVLLVVMILQLLKPDVAEAIASISATFFGVFYVGWLMAHAILLRRMDEILRIKYGAPAEGPFWVGGMFVDQNLGIFLLMTCIAIIAATDAGAYFVGRRFGRTKLAPRVSPNKTVEGAVGGVLGGVFMGAVFWAIFKYGVGTNTVLPFRQMLFVSTLLAVFGILGDLAESLIKRDAKTKDTGTIFPGMGGMLDRIDSHMVSFPVLYYYMSAWFFFRSFMGG